MGLEMQVVVDRAPVRVEVVVIFLCILKEVVISWIEWKSVRKTVASKSLGFVG